MTTWTRWRADLTRPETPTGRDELPFLTASAVVIVAVAQLTDPGSLAEVLLVLPAVAAMALRALLPRLPSEVFAGVVAASTGAAVAHGGNVEITFFLGVLMTLQAARHLGSTTRATFIAAMSAVTPWIVSVVIAPEDLNWTPWASANVFMLVLGRNMHGHQRLIEQLQEAREALADQAVATERQRIARELHDLAGHTLAAVLLHVTGARHVLRRDPDEAERALRDAETVGRSSLDQIRATVVALRTSERGTDAALPGSADLMGLVDEYRRAGLDVTAVVPASVAAIDGPVGTALHRIGREALANVARHAPGNRAQLVVDVDAAAGEVRLVVDDRGRRPAPPGSGAGHFGLVGMRERARALGGDLHARPTDDGWRVEARLPLAATERDRFVAS